MADTDKVIRISREVWDELEGRARKRFAETPDKVLRRILGIEPRAGEEVEPE